MAVAVTLFGAAVGVTAYFAVQEIAESTVVVTMPWGVPDPGIRASVVPAVDSAVTAGSSSIGEGNDPPAASAAAIIDAPPPLLPPQKSSFRRPTNENRIGKGRPASADARAAGEAEATGGRAMRPTPDFPPTVARAPIAQEPPIPDRWDTMNAALASCSGDKFLAGVVCTERVRLQYCEGFWGRSAVQGRNAPG